MCNLAAIAFGGNIGNVSATFAEAMTRLQEITSGCLIRASRTYQTQPIGENAGTAFRNLVILVEVDLPPEELLNRLQQVESEAGRRRGVHWSARPLDLDLIRYNDLVLNSTRLRVPHPLCWCRRFVLDPWEDVDPDWRHPELGETVREMKQRLQIRPLPLQVRGGTEDQQTALKRILLENFPDDISFVRHRDSAAAIIDFDNGPQQKRRIELSPGQERLGVEIIKGALDEPQPLLKTSS